MINRNRNSAVARAQAEMKQAVNSSRRPMNSASVNRPVITNSSRHMSYKTRKAVEYSINCARRRARLNCGVGSKVQIPGILNFIKTADFTECPIAAREFDRATKAVFRMPVGSSVNNVTLSDHYFNTHTSFEEVLYETLKSSESAQELGENDTYYVFLNTYDPAGNKAKFFTGVSCYNGKFTFNPSEMRYFYF